MKPYYDHKGITIYHGDCLEILPELEPVDLVLTDPPYPDYHTELYGYKPELITCLSSLKCKQYVFWTAKIDFPLDYTAIHIWDKKTGCGSQYERIFERNGQKNYKVFNHYLINSTVAASYGRDIFWGHPSQKPIKLIRELLKGFKGVVLDFCAGSGVTLLAAKELNCRAIGVEIDEKWCEIAARRLAQEVLPFGSNQSLETDGQKDGHRSA